jgi:hypothetical protein
MYWCLKTIMTACVPEWVSEGKRFAAPFREQHIIVKLLRRAAYVPLGTQIIQ